ncbi:MAG: hypothetical protein ABJE00_00385 [Erythrobacter sp.]
MRVGSLKIARSDVVTAYNGFAVLKAEVDTIVAGRALIAPPFTELSNTISAAAFGRAIGLRDGRRFLALVEAGYVPATKIINPKTQKKQLRMNDQDISEFHRKFLTLTNAQAEFGICRNRASAIVRAHDAKPSSPKGQDFGSIWLRVDVAPPFASGSRWPKMRLRYS